MDKIFTVAIIGCGSRGKLYGDLMSKGSFNIVAVCDFNAVALENAKNDFNIPENNIFTNEKIFFEAKRADVLVIATQDRDHVRMCIRAMQLGYDVLLEKPISPIKSELKKLLNAQKKFNKKVVVCHVLRYALGFVKIKELLDNKVIGDLIRIESIEQVAYWHQAHSFVRGNWRNDKETSFMLMAKSCHDLDLLHYYAGSKCDTVYSSGSLKFFNKHNQPQGASDRCSDCKYINDCLYSAENLYVKGWERAGKPTNGWPYNVVDNKIPNTDDNLRKAYTGNQYGRCVFACDNNVVDNQSVLMKFENGIEVSFVMTAFTSRHGRIMTFHGTLGEMELNAEEDVITVYPFGKSKYSIKISELAKLNKDEFGHGGGDVMLIKSFYDILSGTVDANTSLENSIESHLMAIAAEKSRKTGKVVKVH